MNVLVTGGAGFVGSHLVRGLLSRGHEVRVLDNFSTGTIANLEPVLKHVELFEGDIRDSTVVLRALRGVEVVFHEAALPSVPRSINDPVLSTHVNVVGTTVVLKAAVDAGVRRLVYAASSSAYGNTTDAVKTETIFPKPRSPYAVTKLAGEYMLQAFAACFPIETVGLRYFNVFGERQDPHSQYSGVIAKFCKLMLLGERPTINGDGLTSRDFTYVANVVEANLLAAAGPSEASGRIFNIACGGNISLNQLVSSLNAILGADLQPVHGQERTGDVAHSRADIRSAEHVLGYRPFVSFEEGLRRTVTWYQSELAKA